MAASIVKVTTTAEETATPCRKLTPSRNMPRKETTTIDPANTTARPEVAPASTTASSTVSPACSPVLNLVTTKSA